jgi:hypothetical protein
VQHRNADRGIFLLEKKHAGRRDGRSRAHGDVARVANQACDYAGKEFFAGVQTNWSR